MYLDISKAFDKVDIDILCYKLRSFRVCLGPVLFLILINDINEGLESSVFLFAVDTRISRKAETENIVETL